MHLLASISRVSVQYGCRNHLNLCCLSSYFRSSSSKSSSSNTLTALPIPRPDYASLLASPKDVVSNLIQRRSPLSLPASELVSRIVALHASVYTLSKRVRDLKSERNVLGRLLADHALAIEAKEEAKKRAEQVKDALVGVDGAEHTLQEQEAQLLELGLQLPNSTHPNAPIGGYEQCEIIRSSIGAGQDALLPTNSSCDHVSLLTSLGWLYQPSHITGPSWPFLLKGGAMLEFALVQYSLSLALKEGFEMVVTPDVVRHQIMRRCGFNPRDSGGEAQTFFVTSPSSSSSLSSPAPFTMNAVSMPPEKEDEVDSLALAATSEIPLAGYFTNNVYRHPLTELPRKLVGTGHAFRAEAGSRGKESRGLYRIHQFTKVELFVVSEAADSDQILKKIVDLQWKILEGLGIPIRFVSSFHLLSCSVNCF